MERNVDENWVQKKNIFQCSFLHRPVNSLTLRKILPRLGRLFLCLGIMLTTIIAKTIESCTKRNNCNQVINCEHIQVPPL